MYHRLPSNLATSAHLGAGNLVELEESSCTGASGLGAGADDGSAVLATAEEHLLTGHSGAVVCLAMYEDHLLFSGSTDCTIKVILPCHCASLIAANAGDCLAVLPAQKLHMVLLKT